MNNILLDNPSYLLKINARPNNGTDPIQEEYVDLSLRGGSGGAAPITTGRFELYFDLDKVESLYIGSGLVCEICYNINTIHYEVEAKEQYNNLQNAIKSWENMKGAYYSFLHSGKSAFANEVEEQRKNMEM
jgi:hypothetical protein